MFDRSLRVKFAAVLVVMSFVPIGLLTVITVGEARSRTFDDETALLAARADQLAGELDRFNEDYQRTSARLARAPEVREAIELLDAQRGAPPDRLAPSIAARLEALGDGDPAVQAVGLLDSTGQVRVATVMALVGLDQASRGYVQHALRGVASISDPYLSERGVPTVAYASPVVAGGRTLGIAVVWVQADVLWRVARRFNGLAGAGSFAEVLDHDGVRIAHSDNRNLVFHPGGVLPDEVMQRLIVERRFGAATRELLSDVRPFPAQFEHARAAQLDASVFHGMAPVSQQINYGVGRRLSSAAWTVFYMVPKDTLTSPITSLSVRRVVVSAVVGIAALLFGALLAAMLVRPLRDLEQQVSRRTAELAATNRQLNDEIAVRAQAEASVRQREQSLATMLGSISHAVSAEHAAQRALVDSERRYRDLHESSDVALAVRHTEDLFRTLLESVKDYAIFMLDREGNVATWNAGAERLKGYTGAEIVGRSFAVFFTPEDRATHHVELTLDQARERGRYEEEGWRVRKNGSRFWANVVITPVRGHDGTLEGFAEVTRDFTEHRTQEDALRAQGAALAQSLRERDVLLQEVHHRVKNNIQVISSLINMQVRRLEHGSTRDALAECQTRVLAIALIHEKLYQSKDYSHVRFSDYVRSLAANVFHATGTSQSDVALELAIDEVPLGVDRAIPCGLLINELITNSLKHAFRERRSGKIRVELVPVDGGALRLTVLDDGVGLPEGLDLRKVESLGLQLVYTLAEQLDASLVVRSERGASFQLTFARSRA